MKKALSVTVGIPTRYTGKSLIHTIRTIYASKNTYPFSCIVVADFTPIPKEYRSEMEKRRVAVSENKKPGTQFQKLRQIIQKTNTDIFIFTQDDIVFEKNTILHIVAAFARNPNVTMVATRVKSVQPQTFFEKIVDVGGRVAYQIGTRWKDKDNYLLANGRCIAFRTSFLKRFRMPNHIINGDGYLYFENRRLGGKFLLSPQAIVYNRNPQTLKEHISQTKRFQYSEKELRTHFDSSIASEYHVPMVTIITAFLEEFVKDPLFMILYIFIFVYAKIVKGDTKRIITPLWETATSTKKISNVSSRVV